MTQSESDCGWLLWYTKVMQGITKAFVVSQKYWEQFIEEPQMPWPGGLWLCVVGCADVETLFRGCILNSVCSLREATQSLWPALHINSQEHLHPHELAVGFGVLNEAFKGTIFFLSMEFSNQTLEVEASVMGSQNMWLTPWWSWGTAHISRSNDTPS